MRLPAGSMASSSLSSNSTSRSNFGLSTRSGGSEPGIWVSNSIRRAASGARNLARMAAMAGCNCEGVSNCLKRQG